MTNKFFLSHEAADELSRRLAEKSHYMSALRPADVYTGYSPVVFRLTSTTPDSDGLYDGVLCHWQDGAWVDSTVTVKVILDDD